MKKKLFRLSVILLGIAFTLVSCERKELTILGEDSSNLHALEALKTSYEDGRDVTISFRPNSFKDALEKANQDFVHKTGLYDIVLQYNFSLASYVKNKFVWNIDSLLLKANNSNVDFEADLFENAWKEVGYYYKNPKNPDVNSLQKVGYPFATNTMILVYNKRMFEDEKKKQDFRKKYGRELEVPTDWSLYKQIAEFFTNSPKSYGVCMQGAEDSWLYYEYCDFLYGMDGSIFNKTYGWEGDNDTEISITSKNSIAATKFYLSLKPYNKGNFYTVDATEQVKLIKEGNVAMGLVWSDYLYGFLEDEQASRFGFAPIPGEKSPIAGGCYYVNRDSQNPQEAIDYILYMMQPDKQVELTLKGLCSPLKSTYENPKVKEAIPYAKALSASLERGTYMYEAGLEANIVSDIITKYIQRLWEDSSLDVASTLQQIASEIKNERRIIYK